MPALGLVTTTIRRAIGGMPQLPIKNFYVESTVTEPSQFVLMGRPGLLASGIFYFTRGSGPINAIYYQEGVISGSTAVLSGTDLYIGSVNKGTVSGTGYASIAGTEIGVVATQGQDAKFYDGTTFRSIAFPDSAYVLKVLAGGSRFVFIRANSQKYYWTEPLSNAIDGSGDLVVDALDFASAENIPDYIVDALMWRGYLVLAGIDSIEFHAYVGDDNLPWVPQVGMVLEDGVAQAGCMTNWNNSFAWVSPNGVVYFYNGSGKQRISDSGIEELITNSSETIWMDSFTQFGHEFLRITGPDDGDLILDAQTMQWSQWSTADGPFLGGRTAAFGNYVVFGSKTDGKCYPLAYDYLTSLDAGTAADKIFRAGFAKDGGVETVHNLLLRCSGGINDDAAIQMRYSRDKGNNWTSWIDGDLGDEGDYRTKVEWRSLGMFDQPGALFEFKIPGTSVALASGGNAFSISGAYYNEFVMGRSR